MQPARADAVRALLVLLDLAEGQAEVASELPLADPERLPALPHALTDMGVDFSGSQSHVVALASQIRLACA
jgi:hypothetical protein